MGVPFSTVITEPGQAVFTKLICTILQRIDFRIRFFISTLGGNVSPFIWYKLYHIKTLGPSSSADIVKPLLGQDLPSKSYRIIRFKNDYGPHSRIYFCSWKIFKGTPWIFQLLCIDRNINTNCNIIDNDFNCTISMFRMDNPKSKFIRFTLNYR